MTSASTTVKIVVSMVVAAALVATRVAINEVRQVGAVTLERKHGTTIVAEIGEVLHSLSHLPMINSPHQLTHKYLAFLPPQSAVKNEVTGLKGSRNLQSGAIALSSATLTAGAVSIGALNGSKFNVGSKGIQGESQTGGTSFGTATGSTPGLGNAFSQGGVSGAGNATSLVFGGTIGSLIQNPNPEVIFGQGFSSLSGSGAGVGTFGAPFAVPGGGFVQPLQTGGGGGGFGLTLGGGIGNVTNVERGYTNAYGTAQVSGFGSGQGAGLFGQAGGNGGGTSTGNGGGSLKPTIGVVAGNFATTLFNGTGGGLASGGAGGYVGFNPNTPVIFGNFGF